MSVERDAKKQVEDALDGLTFPAGKDRIVEYAEGKGSDVAIRLVRAIPLGEYQNRTEVTAAVPADPAAHTDQSDSEKARERRHHTHPGLAETSKDVPANPIEQETGRNRKA